MSSVDTFIQIGATRDGLDPYLACARRRKMKTVLVETPAFLALRRKLGRLSFDEEVAVEEPHVLDELADRFHRGPSSSVLVLAGFERYTRIAAELRQLLSGPSRAATFLPPDKAEQRRLIAEGAPEIRQPATFGIDSATGPVVVKPVDGGGGLGVYRVDDPRNLADAVRHIRQLSNYGGGAFGGVLIQELVRGTEYSLHGVMRDGIPSILTCAEKFISSGADDDPGGMASFREMAHVVSAAGVDPLLQRFARRCLTALAYDRGAFHIDFIAAEEPVLLEVGFRLSGGGLVEAVDRASGIDWAEEAFRAHLGEPGCAGSGERRAVGVVAMTTDDQLEQCSELTSAGLPDGVEIRVPGAVTAPQTERPLLTEPTLNSDLRRHAPVRGRFLVLGPSAALVRSVVEQLLPREVVPACVD
jgi:predicted ATP-grasp superfamily ATP-dependent carboligase